MRRPSHTFHDCCQAIIRESRFTKALDWATGYAHAGSMMDDALTHDEAPHEVKVQCVYLLNNITHWRGDTARAVRQSLKVIGGVK